MFMLLFCFFFLVYDFLFLSCKFNRRKPNIGYIHPLPQTQVQQKSPLSFNPSPSALSSSSKSSGSLRSPVGRNVSFLWKVYINNYVLAYQRIIYADILWFMLSCIVTLISSIFLCWSANHAMLSNFTSKQ